MVALPTTTHAPDFTPFIPEGLRLMGELKTNQFALGDLAIQACGVPVRGRPVSEDERIAVSEFAAGIGAKSRTLQEWRAMAMFWTPLMRAGEDDEYWMFGEDLITSASYNMMRDAKRAALRAYPDDEQRARLCAAATLYDARHAKHTPDSFEASLSKSAGTYETHTCTLADIYARYPDADVTYKQYPDKVVITLGLG